ncbi:hypothetical protein ACFLU6_07900 [Acidobacteriota bacterium]
MAWLPFKTIKPWLLPALEEGRKAKRIEVLCRAVPTIIKGSICELKHKDGGTFKVIAERIFLCGTVVLTWQGERAAIENTRDHGRVILANLRLPEVQT